VKYFKTGLFAGITA